MSERYGEISAVFSGVKFYDREPDDIGDLKNEENHSFRDR